MNAKKNKKIKDVDILEKVHSSSLKFLVPLSLDQAYSLIIEQAQKLIGAEYGSIFLVKNRELERVYATSSMLFKVKIKRRGNVYKTFKSETPRILYVETTKDIHPEIIKAKIKTIILIPLTYLGKTTGVISVLSHKKSLFTSKEIEAIKLFGSISSLLIKKVQISRDMDTAVKDKELFKNLEHILEKVHKASIKFLEPLELKETYRLIVKEALKLVNAHYGSLVLEKNGVFQRVYTTMPVNLSIRKKGNTYKAFIEQKAFFIHNQKSSEHTRAFPGLIRLGIQSVIYIPLLYKKESMGVLVFDSKNEEHFTKKELDILKLFGSLASLAIKKSQLHEETQKALELRDRFISLSSHELRTPLTVLDGYIQLLYKKFSVSDSVEARWVKNIYLESKRLTNLVKDLLEINRLKTGQSNFVFRECNLNEIINQSVKSFNTLYNERKFIIRNRLINSKDVIIGDSDKLSYVFNSILQNAVKFSPNGSSITISLVEKKDNFVIKVIDKGKGISREDTKRIFEDFFKGKNTNEEQGMGVGLYLTKNIIDQHHGSIKVDSQLNKGTRVEVIFPKLKI